jgi:circadian clock protein KaiC
MRIKAMARLHKVRCLVIDPVSALAKSGNEETAYNVAERLIDWTKDLGITLLCTSLLHESGPNLEGTPMQVSTIADTWLHLSYLVQSGERNRGLSIVKSRGMAHSNQVRELVLSKDGVTLADAFTAGGEVLMGTLRWEKEDAVRTATEESTAAAKLKQATLESEEALLEVRLKALQLELQVKRTEKQALSRVASDLTAGLATGMTHLHELRGVDKV